MSFRVLITAAAAGAALMLAPAWADDAAATYRVIEADTHIPATRAVNGYELIDEDTILIKTGANRWYAAEMTGTCGRSARFDWSIGIDSNGGGRIDRHSEVVVVDGRRCAIRQIDLVERLPTPEAEPAS